jgi:hypothetical protein
MVNSGGLPASVLASSIAGKPCSRLFPHFNKIGNFTHLPILSKVPFLENAASEGKIQQLHRKIFRKK